MYLKHRMLTRLAVFVFILACGAALAPQAGAQIDSVNVGLPLGGGTWGDVDNGWFYTPSFSYNLTGVSTDYGSVTGQTVTEVIFNANGTNIGSQLTSATFVPVANVFSGPSFGAIPLTAGQEYFVAFENVSNLGLNVTSSGAATFLNERYDFGGAGFGDFDSAGSDLFTAPELEFFGGAGTPEPGPGAVSVAFATSLSVAAAIRRRRRS